MHFTGNLPDKVVNNLKKYAKDKVKEKGDELLALLIDKPELGHIVSKEKISMKKFITTEWNEENLKKLIEKHGAPKTEKTKESQETSDMTSDGISGTKKRTWDYYRKVLATECTGEFPIKLKYVTGAQLP
eukprot:UN33922